MAAMPALGINAADSVRTASVEEPEGSAPAFDPAELARSLRRGAEVDRFHELAARQEALTAAESDELYRYRLRRLLTRVRRLDRLASSEDEESIRQTLDDFWSRLAELRAFEARRRQAGLPAGYALDRTAEERAITRLLTLAARRPHGLIAGTDEVSDQATGSLRVRDVPFAPSPEDLPVYILAPSTIPSDTLARHVAATAAAGARIRVVRDPNEIPPEATVPLVLNWGSIQPLPQDLVALNRPEAVRVASDQVESLQRLRELAPRTVVNPSDLGLLGSAQVVAKRRRGSRGSGKAVLRADGPIGAHAGYDLYQEFIPECREYRLSVLSERIVSAYLKRAPDGSAPNDLRRGWSLERTPLIPQAVAAVAIESARRVGLDYTGVDVVEDLRTGRVYCLEANAAPGMSEDTIKSVYAHIQQTLRGRLARAS